MTFQKLNISPAILKALEAEQYSVPTPIQEKAIPPALEGHDLLGVAQTGTGKTAAYAIPTLQRLGKPQMKAEGPQQSHFSPQMRAEGPQMKIDGLRRQGNSRPAPRKIRALVLTPTRELALQIYESFRAYGRFMELNTSVVYGGVSQRPQEQALRSGVDILVATPGRLLDLWGQRLIDLSQIEILILDEADRMLDMGFINDVRKIIAQIPPQRQTLFFSATMPPEIVAMSRSILTDPVKVTITPESPTVESIDQSVYLVDRENKSNLLVHLLRQPAVTSALVFSRTKHGADRIARFLTKNQIEAQVIHGDKSQNAREQALNSFKNKTARVLVATDLAARGIDIIELSHVINVDLPDEAESYIHRIGRTGRAGKGGIAISFCAGEERKQLRDIERLCAKPITRVTDHPFPMLHPESETQPVQSYQKYRMKHRLAPPRRRRIG